MKKALLFTGIMAQVGTFATVALLLWYLTSVDAIEILCVSELLSAFISLPALLRLEEFDE